MENQNLRLSINDQKENVLSYENEQEVEANNEYESNHERLVNRDLDIPDSSDNENEATVVSKFVRTIRQPKKCQDYGLYSAYCLSRT